MDLATTYLGLPLAHPLITGASPLVDHMDLVRRLEDAGAAAITMHSLFEEQLAMDAEATRYAVEAQAHSHPEAESYFPLAADYALGPDEYLEQIHRIKAAVRVPVIASLNGVTGEGWTGYARLIEQAGADALELNMYVVAVNPIESGGVVERRLLDVTAAVRSSVALPIAVKLSPFWSSVSHLAASLDGVGADGLVLFNRFYQPDIDVDDAGRRAASAPVRSLRAAAEDPLARGAGRPRPRIAGGERRRPRRRGRGQGADGRRRRRPDRLRAARARARAPAGAARGARALDGGA